MQTGLYQNLFNCANWIIQNMLNRANWITPKSAELCKLVYTKVCLTLQTGSYQNLFNGANWIKPKSTQMCKLDQSKSFHQLSKANCQDGEWPALSKDVPSDVHFWRPRVGCRRSVNILSDCIPLATPQRSSSWSRLPRMQQLHPPPPPTTQSCKIIISFPSGAS